jgi:hypothetical protein
MRPIVQNTVSVWPIIVDTDYPHLRNYLDIKTPNYNLKTGVTPKVKQDLLNLWGKTYLIVIPRSLKTFTQILNSLPRINIACANGNKSVSLIPLLCTVYTEDADYAQKCLEEGYEVASNFQELSEHLKYAVDIYPCAELTLGKFPEHK